MNLLKSRIRFALLIIPMILLAAVSFGQSQTQMNLEADGQYKKADKELNVVYQKIIKEYASNVTFIKNLKTAQRLWVQLRDAELAAKYPEHGSYGSVEPMCVARFLEGLTKERTKYLKVWLDGILEGESCSGSVKMKNE